MTVRLRAHHLLCMLTFVGRGYTPAFTAHLAEVIKRLDSGEEITLVEGPDEICQGWLDDPAAHCRLDRVFERDRLARAAMPALLDDLEVGGRPRLGPDDIARMREAFASGASRAACLGCEWAAFCTAIADIGFAEARLTGRP